MLLIYHNGVKLAEDIVDESTEEMVFEIHVIKTISIFHIIMNRNFGWVRGYRGRGGVCRNRYEIWKSCLLTNVKAKLRVK